MRTTNLSDIKTSSPPTNHRERLISPGWMGLIFAASIFTVELLIMIVFLILPPLPPLIEPIVDSTSLIVLIAPVLYFFSYRPLTRAIAERNEVIEENLELNRTLSRQVAERTQELTQRANEMERLSEVSARRAGQFAAIGQIARAIASFEELDTLLPRITQLVSQQFGFYHVGIFLNDDSNQYAVLSAANSEGGKHMLARGHQLRVGAEGIVGYVTGTGRPRVALDTGVDAVFFNNPDLPRTRSEMALPLTIAGKVIGALDVQSTESNAFGQDDIEVLATLADQISIAIQNARSFVETKRLLNESRSILGEYITESWKVFKPESLTTGYKKVGIAIKPLQQSLDGEHIHEAVRESKTVSTPTQLAIPIRLRGDVIGVMSLNIPEGRQWSANEVSIAEAVAERLSLAVETATLIKATQHRANIERVTADITGRISTSANLETILQTAAQELNRALGGSDVLVQIEPVSLKLSTSG